MTVKVYAPGISVEVFNTLPSTGTGIVTQVPLPAKSGSTFGQNYYGFPYVNNGSCKQNDMVYCPLTDRIYVQGGDSLHSATDGTWSFKTNFSDIRLEVAQPIYNVLAAPHAYQDDFGYAWVPSKNQLVIWPGGCLGYEPPGTLILNYTGGVWWYDPIAKVYTQDTRLFPNRIDPANNISPGITCYSTGCPYGGVLDPATNIAYTLADGGAYAMLRWDFNAMVKLPNQTFFISKLPNGGNVSYFAQTRPLLFNGKIYFMGYATDGTQLKIPRFWAWDIASATIKELSAAPVPIESLLETQLNISHGKIVWINTGGPDGTVHGIYWYDIPNNIWTQDTQTLPASFMGNMTLSLPDGRICLAGTVFGVQQSMFNFYEVQ